MTALSSDFVVWRDHAQAPVRHGLAQGAAGQRLGRISPSSSTMTSVVAAFSLGLCSRRIWNRLHQPWRPCAGSARLKLRAQDVVGRAGFLRNLQWPLGLLGGRQKSSNQTATLEKDFNDTSPEEELARLTNPQQNVAILGTRDCTYNHQQEIEALTQGHVERGHRIFTSGSSGTNSAVIKAVLDKGRPELLTVELPQSLGKQDDEVQVLLERCKEEGVTICPHRECDHLELAAAAAKCNTRILGQVDRLVVFATHRSDKYLGLVQEAKDNNVMVAAFNVEV
ncbi:unnamed protein product [Symbiodinium microadriaticum]|nr:unnamed protein product [Symbiodinium microadriaticum]CAE7942719.1 unnamed protein product [Symbiodinium sp. KB8]